MSIKKETYEYYLKVFRIEYAAYKREEEQLRSAPPKQREDLQERLQIRSNILQGLGEMLEMLKRDLESERSETK